MQVLIPVFVFLTILCFALSVQTKLQPVKVDVRGRLGQVVSSDGFSDIRQAELSRPLSERILRPTLGQLSTLVGSLLPAGMLKALEPKVIRAGNPGGLTASEFLGLKVFLVLGLPALYYYTSIQTHDGRLFLILTVAAVVGWKLPEIYLTQKLTQKAQLLEKSFPDTLDLLTVSVEAGLGFEGAVAKVVEKDSGPIGLEFKRVLQETKMGKSRKEALRDFAERTGVDDIVSFVNAIVQAEQLGLGIGNTLRNQSELMRRKRRQRIEEQAMKAPVKMLIPLVVFIFPTIFIVLLGPAAIQIMGTLLN